MSSPDKFRDFVEPPEHHPGREMRVTRESLAALTVALSNSLDIEPGEVARFVGLWFMVQQTQEGLVKAGPLNNVPEQALSGFMGPSWVLFFGMLLARWAVVKAGQNLSREDQAKGTEAVVMECDRVVRRLVNDRTAYDLAVAAAQAKGLFEPRYDIDNWPEEGGVKIQPAFPELEDEIRQNRQCGKG